MKINADRPFASKPFLKGVLKSILSMKFKLYGRIPAKLLSNDLVEIDFNMGKIHITEKDFKILSKIMNKLNKKYKTNITYCIYHSDNYPDNMLLNIRCPKAPTMLSTKIEF